MVLELDLAADIVVLTTGTVLVDTEGVCGTVLSALSLFCSVTCSD